MLFAFPAVPVDRFAEGSVSQARGCAGEDCALPWERRRPCLLARVSQSLLEPRRQGCLRSQGSPKGQQ